MTEENVQSIEMPANTPLERIQKAINIAVQYGGIDGAHHKDWAIDQIVRALTGCPVEPKTSKNWQGDPISYLAQGESDEYKQVVKEACSGEDGPDSYEWNTGIAP